MKSNKTNHLTTKLTQLRELNEKALVCFLTAGFPTTRATVPIVLEIAKAGADIIELGMPFSDPLADGPVIQHSSAIALRQGITLDIILSQVKEIRQNSNVPLVLMGYLNPILTYGAEKFFEAAVRAGVDGVILPELPLEESGRYESLLNNFGLANILLVTPTTPPDRIVKIDSVSKGFLYCVSTTGVTGSVGKAMSSNYIHNVKKFAKKNPVLVGFGIKTPDDAQRIAKHADGVIVGSALIQKIANGESTDEIIKWIRQMKDILSTSH